MSAGQAGPDPSSATTPEEFVELLRDIRADSGLSFWEIQRIAHDHGYDLEPAALVHALGQPVLPDWQIVAGLLTACGYQRKQVDPWLRVHRDLADHALPLPDEELDVAVRPARRWSYQHVLYAAAGGAVAVFVLLVAVTWNSEPGPDAALTASSVRSPQPGPADSAPPVPRPATAVTSAPAALSASQPPPPVSPATVPVGTVTLTSGKGVDLDTGLASGDLDIVATSGTGLTVGDNRKRLQRMPSMPTEQTCQLLNLGRLERDIEDLASGQWLCVLTSSGRWARVNITSSGDSITLSYLVWA